MKNKKQPEMRFPGFDGDWKQHKLGEMLEERNEQITESDEYPLMSFVQGIGVTPKGERYDRSFLVKDDKKKYKKTELGDFIYSSNNLETGSIGFNKTGKAVISPVYSIFSSKTKLESQFIGIMSTRKDFINKMIHYRQGVVYGQWRIHEKDFLNIKVNIPVEKEQKEIIEFFKQLDDTIALHQQKLINLKQTKQGFLQKMFPKEGENVPEIRFPGFTDAWEQRKLNTLAEFNPKSNLPEIFEYVDLESVVGTKLVGHRTENRDSAPSRAQRLAKKNDVFYQTVRPYQKNNYIFDLPYDNYVFSTGYAQMRPIGNGYFLLTLVQEDKFVNRVLERSTGTSYPAINSNELAQLPVKVPANIEEQKQIGSFFKQLDDTITLHQRELDLLQETKKAFLQKMFI